MGFKERMEEERQRRDARAYFRQHNSEFFSPSKWALIIVATLLAGIGIGVGLGLLTNMLGIFFSVLYIAGAYLILKVATLIAGTTNSKLMIVCMIAYTLMILVTQTFAYYGLAYLAYFDISDVFVYFVQSLTSLRRSYLTILFIFSGYAYIYQNLK